LPNVTRPTAAVVNLGIISKNLKSIRQKVGGAVKVMAVVKANAYGHGLIEVSRFLERQPVEYFGVANAEEGVALREAGIRTPILVFTLPALSQSPLFGDFSLEATVCSEPGARALHTEGERRGQTLPVHLKVDTGMNRIGVKVADLAKLLKVLSRMRRLEIRGVYTHFATADRKESTFTQTQLEEFRRALEFLRKEGVSPEHVHCAGSGAIMHLPESYFTMVRPGLALYGSYPSERISRSFRVEPALTLRTRVSLVKWIGPGETVSYGRRFTARRRTQIATLPIGYADGYPRALSGRAEVLLGGRRFPVAGTICMDQLMVDVGRADVGVGDEAILIGRQGGQTIDAWDLARLAGTIPYEIFTNISSRVPRIYDEP
jgi:alanine racemase